MDDMERIVSGTTRERVWRTVILTVWIGVFAVWFLKDGFITYPEENVAKAAEALDPPPEPLPEVRGDVTADAVKALAESLAPTRLTRRELESAWGAPGWEGERGSEIRYFGPAGQMVVSLTGDLVTEAEFVDGEHTQADLITQKLLGGILGVIVIGMLIQLIRVFSTRVVLDDSGLRVGRRGPIPLSAMTGIEASDFRRKGILDIKYEMDGKSGSVRLDDYVVGAFRPIVTAICEARGFENPVDRKDEAEGGDEGEGDVAVEARVDAQG
jgi:hypothetical protein